jgi:methylmalonyl-CoA mutase C-terminal domain/subunit
MWHHPIMANRRVVLGAVGDGETLPALARMLRDTGHEVVLVGGQQTAEQLVRSAVAEDASELVVLGEDEELAEVDSVRLALGADDVRLTAGADLLRTPRV